MLCSVFGVHLCIREVALVGERRLEIHRSIHESMSGIL